MATDFQNLADGIEAATSVMSVQVLEDGSMGELRVVAGNRAYIDSIERPAGDYQMRTNKFVPNSIYTDYVPRDLNFEDFCFRSAVQKKCLHSYVKPSQMPVWFNMTFLPVGPSDGNIHYCTYTMEVNFKADTQRMSNVSADLASEVLETCLKLRGADDFKSAVHEVIKDIRKMCKAEQCSILLVDEYEKTTSVLGVDHDEDVSAVNREKNTVLPGMPGFYEIAESWKELIGSSNCIIAKSEQDMEFVKERNPEWYQSLIASGARNIVLFPLKAGERLLGYMWAVNYDVQQAPRIKETLELTTFILGSEISNNLLLDRLKVLSSKDMLTGLLNRNEMNNQLEKLSESKDLSRKSVGIVFADLNGLKRVNDELGHSSGDALLRDAARALEEVFPSECIYRAGGDEFIAILPGVTEDEVKDKTDALRKASEKYERLSFSIGSYVEEDPTEVNRALKMADQRMYEDKKEYYKMHPNLDRRHRKTMES